MILKVFPNQNDSVILLVLIYQILQDSPAAQCTHHTGSSGLDKREMGILLVCNTKTNKNQGEKESRKVTGVRQASKNISN